MAAPAHLQDGCERLLQGGHIHGAWLAAAPDGKRRSRTGGFAGRHAGGHDPNGALRVMRRADAASGDQKAVERARDEAAIGNVVCAPLALDEAGAPLFSGRVMDIDAVAVVRDGVRELPPLQNILAAQLIDAADPARFTDADAVRRAGRC